MKSLTDAFTLRNNVPIPCVGYGTWQTPDGATCVNSVKEAIAAGYRHIDAAAIYGNEESVGIGIKESGIARDELFLTGKVWNTERGYDKTMRAFEKTCKDLLVETLDLYLIHWPAVEKQFSNWKELNRDTWKALMQLYHDQRVRAIGISNFKVKHMELLTDMEELPMVNQIEYHPGWLQEEIVSYCKKNNILVEAYSPLGSGRILQDDRLKEMAARYNKSVAQLCLRFILQSGVLPLPKSVTPARIKENADIFDFTISDEDMKTIAALPDFGDSGQDPDEIDF